MVVEEESMTSIIALWLHVHTQGGDEIDDIFGCTTTGDDGSVVVADTFNVAGGGRNNVGDNSTLVMISYFNDIPSTCKTVNMILYSFKFS